MNNYHTHTFRCGHAVGTEKEYIETAIKEGYKAIGFSEHVPLPYFRWHLCQALPYTVRSIRGILSWGKSFLLNGPGMRMTYSQKKIHLKELDMLKKTYEGKIKIYKGFECEYLRAYLPYYQRLLKNGEVDYLIFGHHYHRFAVSSQYYGRKHIQKSDVVNYVDEAILAMQTNLFKYFAHPDLFFVGYHHWDEFVEQEVRRLLLAAKENHVILEINAGGHRRKKVDFDGKDEYPYPRIQFWKIAKETGCEVVIGLDAHHPKHLDHHIYHELEAFSNEIGLIQSERNPENNFGDI